MVKNKDDETSKSAYSSATYDTSCGTTSTSTSINLKVNTTPVKRRDSKFRSSSPAASIASHNLTILTGGEEYGSQAWCIVICCFLVNIVVMGFLKCLGILIIEVQKSYKATPAHVSVLVSITSCLNCVAGPLACYLVLKFTARSIAFMGTVLVSVGLMLSWFATSITFLYFSIGVLVGLGSGFTYSPGLILIGNYFQKNRGMANGVVVSGSPVGGMIMPYMLNFLIQYLDCRGALLILGGIMMNAVICTLSYKPYRAPPPKKVIAPASPVMRGHGRSASFNKMPANSNRDDSCMKVIRGPEEDESDESSGPEFIPDEMGLKSQNKLKKRVSSLSTGSVIVYKINEKYGHPHCKETRCFPEKLHKVLSRPPFWTKPENDSSKMRKLSGMGQNVEPKASQTEIHPHNVQENQIIAHPYTTGLVKRNAKVGSGGGSGHLGSSGKFTFPPATPTRNSKCHTIVPPSSTKLNQESEQLPSGFLRQSQTGSQTIGADLELRNRKLNKDRREPPSPQAVSTKRLPPYIMSLDHSCVIMWSNDNLTKGRLPIGKLSSTLTVSVKDEIQEERKNVHDHGEHVSQEFKIKFPRMAKWLIGAFIYDRKFLPPTVIFASGLVLAGVSSFFIGMADTFLKFSSFGGMFGFSCGLHIGIFGALLAEVVGIALLPVGYAFCMMLNGILQFSFINISGKILSTDSEAYESLYCFYGICLVVGGSLWVIPFIADKLNKLNHNLCIFFSRQRQENADNENAEN
ncbi:Monocarboxylate transporter 12 [Folsomia candida]|uniref:Monocarboxylate transporter 12 n=1 Tax=Folsomia candida TaxID=158441 RepID=A0A226EWI3_FOLCA|nr:Monocarboxylate transporter 12 [Folsomia candida]